jgi:uncharacterized membrane protein
MIEISESGDYSVYQRLVWSLVWFGILDAGIATWGTWSTWAAAGYVAPLVVLAGIIGMAVVWLEESAPSAQFQHLSVLFVAIAAVVSKYGDLTSNRFYATDSAAFAQRATSLLLHGKNPYASSLSGASYYLKNISNFWTYTLNGGHVDHLSYPAGSLLLQAPVQYFVHVRPTDWVDLGAWLVAMVLMYALMPATMRWIAPLLMLVGPYLFLSTNGSTDALFIPFLILAVWRWDRFVDYASSRWVRWLGPVALGVACSIKQSPWFCVPFLAFGIFLEARTHQQRSVLAALRYVAIVAVVFLAINAPFIYWSSSLWLHGILLPLTHPLVPDGQGLITLATHGVIRGVRLRLLTLAGLAGCVTVAVSYALWYKNLKRGWLFLLPVVLFLPSRSLSTYLVDYFPAAIVAAATITAPSAIFLSSLGKRARRVLTLLPIVATATLVALSFSSPVVGVRLETFRTSDNNTYLMQIEVRVTNNTDREVNAHVLVDIAASHATGFWKLPDGESELSLRPHESREVWLTRPSTTYAPLYGQHWLVGIYSNAPQSLSTSVPVTWQFGKPH